MTIEIQRFENFYWVRHSQRTTIGDTIVEIANYNDLLSYVDALMCLVRRQTLEEVIVAKEIIAEQREYITAASKANQIIADMIDDEKDEDEGSDCPDPLSNDVDNDLDPKVQRSQMMRGTDGREGSYWK